MTTGGVFGGIDFGTTSVRAARFSEDGGLLDETRWHLTTDRDEDGRATQSFDGWVRPLLAWLAGGTPLEAWSVGGQMNTYCLADERGRPLGDAITWQDGRRARAASEGVAVTSAAARAALFAEEHPEAWARARYMLLPKDVLVAATAGRPFSDRLSWNGVFRVGTDQLAEGLTSEVRGKLPPIERPEFAAPTPLGIVAAGIPDTIAVLLGAGLDDTAAYDISGTSETVAGIAADPQPSGGFQSSVPLHGSWVHAGPSNVGGVTLQWAADVLTSGDVAGLVAAAAGVMPRDTLPLFVPYLLGERAPLWNAGLHGSWRELRMDHGVPELAWAVLEGVGFAVRLGLDHLRRSTHREPQRHIATMKTVELGELRAVALGADLDVVADPLVGCRGAAALAYAAARGIDLAVASVRFRSSREVVRRDRSLDGIMMRRFDRWRAMR